MYFREYIRLKSEKSTKKQAEQLQHYFEKEESAFLMSRADESKTLYTDDVGFVGLFPMDILHTVSKGIVDILTQVIDSYIEQSSSRKKKTCGC